jgi:hypothetical protein
MSDSSQPSSWHSQLKHCTLSGLAVVGLQTKPANARSCAEGDESGHAAAFDFVPAFFDLLLVRRVLVVVAAPPKVARRAWSDASAASMVFDCREDLL